MKTLKLLIPVILLFSLAGCFDIHEEIEVNKNGSGQMSINMDMSQLLDIMQTYVGKDEMEKQLPKRMMDTTILMKDLVDTARDMPAEKKALVREGRIHMKLNMDEKLFKTDIHFPFKNLSDLQKLYTSMNDGSLNTTKLFSGLASGKDSANNAGNMPDIGQFNGIYDFQSRDGLITRKLNPEKWKQFQDGQQFAQAKEVGNMGMEVGYTLTLSLPRSVKKIDNPLAVLSEDKKTVTMKYNFVEVFSHPEKFEYTIAY